MRDTEKLLEESQSRLECGQYVLERIRKEWWDDYENAVLANHRRKMKKLMKKVRRQHALHPDERLASRLTEMQDTVSRFDQHVRFMNDTTSYTKLKWKAQKMMRLNQQIIYEEDHKRWCLAYNELERLSGKVAKIATDHEPANGYKTTLVDFIAELLDYWEYKLLKLNRWAEKHSKTDHDPAGDDDEEDDTPQEDEQREAEEEEAKQKAQDPERLALLTECEQRYEKFASEPWPELDDQQLVTEFLERRQAQAAECRLMLSQLCFIDRVVYQRLYFLRRKVQHFEWQTVYQLQLMSQPDWRAALKQQQQQSKPKLGDRPTKRTWDWTLLQHMISDLDRQLKNDSDELSKCLYYRGPFEWDIGKLTECVLWKGKAIKYLLAVEAKERFIHDDQFSNKRKITTTTTATTKHDNK